MQVPFRRRALFVIPALALLCVLAASLHHPVLAARKSSHPAADAAHTRLIQQGRLIFVDTPDNASKWTGNTLSCTDCHLMGGTAEYAAPLTATAARYPRFSKRAGHTVTLQERIQECFVRSQNGKPLPVDSAPMKALVAYIDSLHSAAAAHKPYQPLVPLPALTGNPARGKAVYVAQCLECHQANGAGLPGAYPAVWGPDSYNDGAGMARVPTLAAWVKHNMPQNRPGILTPQQSYDVAAYIDSQPRPKFNPANKKY